MGNDKNVGVKKEKGIRKLTDRISFWKAKSQADEEERHSPKPKPKLKKIKALKEEGKALCDAGKFKEGENKLIEAITIISFTMLK